MHSHRLHHHWRAVSLLGLTTAYSTTATARGTARNARNARNAREQPLKPNARVFASESEKTYNAGVQLQKRYVNIAKNFGEATDEYGWYIGYYCSGSIVTKDYVLSAAACPKMCGEEVDALWWTDEEGEMLYGAKAEPCTEAQTFVHALVYSSYTNDPDKVSAFHQSQVEEFIYGSGATEDLMLMRLKKSFVTPDFVSITPKIHTDSEPLSVDTEVKVMGYGKSVGLWNPVDPSNPGIENQEVYEVPLYLQARDTTVESCDADASGSTTCIGYDILCTTDVGSPLYMEDGSALIGIALGGLDCYHADSQYPHQSMKAKFAMYTLDVDTWVKSVTTGESGTGGGGGSDGGGPNPEPQVGLQFKALSEPRNKFTCDIKQRRYSRLGDGAKMNWHDAQTLCRRLAAPRKLRSRRRADAVLRSDGVATAVDDESNEGGLATVSDNETLAKMSALISNFPGSNAVWVGARTLKGKLVGVWDKDKWESGVRIDSTFMPYSERFNAKNPRYLKRALCLAVDSTGKYFPAPCDSALQFICEDCQGSPTTKSIPRRTRFSRRGALIHRRRGGAQRGGERLKRTRTTQRSKRSQYRSRQRRFRQRRFRQSGTDGSSAAMYAAGGDAQQVPEPCRIGSLSCAAFYGLVAAAVLVVTGGTLATMFLIRRRQDVVPSSPQVVQADEQHQVTKAAGGVVTNV